MYRINITDKTKEYMIFAGGVLLCLFLGWFGYLLTNELSFAIFYLFPISAVAWLASVRLGFVSAVFAGLVWLLSDLAGGHGYSDAYIPYANASMRMLVFIVVVFLIMKAKRKIEEEEKQANEDFMTKISNSRAFYNYCSLEIEKLKRYKIPFTLIYFDVDNFKKVNDSFGHSEGNGLLRGLAVTVRKNLRTTDIVARLGGDEFGILLIEAAQNDAREIAEKIKSRLEKKMKNKGWPVTFSMGSVTYYKSPDTVDNMIRIADEVMYNVKFSGKNRIDYAVYS